MKAKQNKQTPVIENRKARHNFHITETLEVGVVLHGTEVKSIRAGRVHIKEAWVDVTDDLELWLVNCRIDEYAFGNRFNHSVERRRKLLAHRHEILKLHRARELKGLTIAPLKMYFSKGKVKLQIGLAQGKNVHDKRQTLIQRTQKREMDRAMKQRI